ncbi:PiggyBac transposable element-derived protein [Trinorchestia longiramus]|nr:PiggyBac transposable element-derived protein [Trinorchestia longiramus]
MEGLSGTESLTVGMAQKILNTGSTIFADNYYPSVGLAEYVLGKKTYVCGTIRKIRKRLSKEVVVAKLKKYEMECLENCSGIKLYNWRDKRNMFMISTVLEHDGSLVPSGKTNRNGEELKKPQCILDYNNAKKGVDVSDQMTSCHTALRRSLKWHRKVDIETITGMSVVNAHVLYNKYFADAAMSIRHFRESLALSLTGIVEKNIRPGRSCTVIQGKSHPHMLIEGERGKRKRCLGCYEKLSSNENCQVARNKARKVTTYCNLCESKPHICVSCFSEKHGNI